MIREVYSMEREQRKLLAANAKQQNYALTFGCQTLLFLQILAIQIIFPAFQSVAIYYCCSFVADILIQIIKVNAHIYRLHE